MQIAENKRKANLYLDTLMTVFSMAETICMLNFTQQRVNDSVIPDAQITQNMCGNTMGRARTQHCKHGFPVFRKPPHKLLVPSRAKARILLDKHCFLV